MLLFKTYIKESAIPNAGMGCFAAEFIPKGSMLWFFNSEIDRLITPAQFATFTELEKDFLSMYCYMQRGDYYLCVDNGRFFNHSAAPNTFESPSEQATFAAVDIQVGDEITSDYAKFGDTPDDMRFNLTL
jgi:SET domain-containing protein